MTTESSELARRHMPWWLLLIGGIAPVIIGICLLANPFKTANVLVLFIAIYWLVTGVISLCSLFFDRSHWGWKLFTGVLGILAGWILMRNPAEGTLIFGLSVVLVLAIQGILMGTASLLDGFQSGDWRPAVLGVLSIIIGILLLVHMGAATIILPWVVGIFAIAAGIAVIALAFRVRAVLKEPLAA